MVSEWGMSDVLGPIAFGDQDEQPFLGRELAHARNYSERTAQTIDDEVRRFLTEGYELARRLITEHLDEIKLLADGLIEFETLDIEDVNILLEKGIEGLRTEREAREKEDKPRVAKVAFQSKLAALIANEMRSNASKDAPNQSSKHGNDDNAHSPDDVAKNNPDYGNYAADRGSELPPIEIDAKSHDGRA